MCHTSPTPDLLYDSVLGPDDVYNKPFNDTPTLRDTPYDDYIMPTYQYFIHRNKTPVSERTETVLRQDLDPDNGDFPAPSPIMRVLNYTQKADGTVTYRLQLSDLTYRNDVPEAHVLQSLL